MMKKMFALALVALSLLLSLTFSVSTFSQEITNQNEQLVCNLDGIIEKKEIIFVNSENEEVHLSIEPLFSPSLSKAGITQGKYRVSKNATGSWSCSYIVTINANSKISAATNLDLKALKGSILSSSLTHTTTKATCNFKQKAGIITSSRSVVATISGNSLIVK